MKRLLNILLSGAVLLPLLMFPVSVSAADDDVITKEEKSFEFVVFTRYSIAHRHIASLRSWTKDCSDKMRSIFMPQSMPVPTINEYGVDREFTGFKKCYFDSGDNVPETMQDIADVWNAEICLKFDAVSRRTHALSKTTNRWDWTTGLEEINGNLNSIGSSLEKIKSMLKQRMTELEIKRKAEQEAKKELGVKDDSCFIATASYGTSTSEKIDTLRRFRDRYLLKSPVGQEFVEFYYVNSPPLATIISENEILRIIIREGVIEPVVRLVELTECCWAE
jgi:hypothetical protein